MSDDALADPQRAANPETRQFETVSVTAGSGQAALVTLRRRLLKNTIHAQFQMGNWRLWTALFSSLLFWAGTFVFFRLGFRELFEYGLMNAFLVELLFAMFFSTLTVMLLFSSGILGYSGMFESKDTRMLLIRPVRPDYVFAHKFGEALFFSSWGFLVLSTPLVLAYGLQVNAPFGFYILSIGFFAAFTVIPTSIGMLCCLLVAALMPRRRTEFLILLLMGMLIAAVFYGFQSWQKMTVAESWLNTLVRQLKVTNTPFLPASWMTAGLLAATDGNQLESLFYLALMTSNAAFSFVVSGAAYRLLFRRAYDRVHSNRSQREVRHGSFLSTLTNRLFPFLSSGVRVLIAKDLRTFFRNPVQSLQLLIFMGLISFYLVMLSRLSFYSDNPYWRNMVGCLNLGVLGMFITVITSRFIFPLLSLEGQQLWILGLSPLSRDAVLWGKFAFSFALTFLLSSGLALVSLFTLDIDPIVRIAQIVSVPILCAGLSGVSVGFGARFAEMKETDPSRIASGFAGTLNLIVSMGYLVSVLIAIVVPTHMFARHAAGFGGSNSLIGFVVAMTLCLTLAVLAVYLPMRWGTRHFRSMEF